MTSPEKLATPDSVMALAHALANTLLNGGQLAYRAATGALRAEVSRLATGRAETCAVAIQGAPIPPADLAQTATRILQAVRTAESDAALRAVVTRELLNVAAPPAPPAPLPGKPLTKDQIAALLPLIQAEVDTLSDEGRYTFAGWLPIAVRLIEKHHGIAALSAQAAPEYRTGFDEAPSTFNAQDAAPADYPPPDAALAEFTDYFVRNYPGPDTIITDPKWHAPKLFRAAQRAISRAGLRSGVSADPLPLTDTYVQPVPDKCDRITWRGQYYHLPVSSQSQPLVEPTADRKSLNAMAADLLRPYLKEGQKVIWREAFRWQDDNGVLSNHYDGMELEQLADDFGYDWRYDMNFKHAAIVWKLKSAADAAAQSQPLVEPTAARVSFLLEQKSVLPHWENLMAYQSEDSARKALPVFRKTTSRDIRIVRQTREVVAVDSVAASPPQHQAKKGEPS